MRSGYPLRRRSASHPFTQSTSCLIRQCARLNLFGAGTATGLPPMPIFSPRAIFVKVRGLVSVKSWLIFLRLSKFYNQALRGSSPGPRCTFYAAAKAQFPPSSPSHLVPSSTLPFFLLPCFRLSISHKDWSSFFFISHPSGVSLFYSPPTLLSSCSTARASRAL